MTGGWGGGGGGRQGRRPNAEENYSVVEWEPSFQVPSQILQSILDQIIQMDLMMNNLLGVPAIGARSLKIHFYNVPLPYADTEKWNCFKTLHTWNFKIITSQTTIQSMEPHWEIACPWLTSNICPHCPGNNIQTFWDLFLETYTFASETLKQKSILFNKNAQMPAQTIKTQEALNSWPLPGFYNSYIVNKHQLQKTL